MEEVNNHPSKTNSIDVNKVLQSSFASLNKKRKFQEEKSALPLPKHKSWDRSFSLESDSTSNENLRVEDLNLHKIKGKTVGREREDESELESAKDSNSFGEDTDSPMYVSNEAKVQSEYPKTFPSDRPSTSSVNWDSDSFKNSLYSLDGTDRVQSPYIGRDHNFPHNDFGLHTCLNFDEHLLESGSQIDYSCLEHGNDSTEQCTNKELEGTPKNNYVLSSGRWSVNQEPQMSTKKLTIDKEFEQYFSTLML